MNVLSDLLCFFERKNLSLIRTSAVASFPLWIAGVRRMFRKIQRSIFFPPVMFMQPEMKVEKESPVFPLQEFPWVHFQLTKSSQSTVASAAFILKSWQAYSFHFSFIITEEFWGDVHGQSVQPRFPASEVTNWSFKLQVTSWAGYQQTAHLATYVASLCGSQECEEAVLAPCACATVTVPLAVCRFYFFFFCIRKKAFLSPC